MNTEEQLISEIDKWTKKINEERQKITIVDESNSGMIKNIDAYISDSKHFLERKDYVRAFEAIIWSWSWLDILKELEIIKTK